MPKETSPNKINRDQERRADQIESRLRKQGMGEDQAEKEALAQAVEEKPGGHGGGSHAGGEAKKDSSHVGPKRLGSDSNASK